MHDFPENRLCRTLSHPLTLGIGILLLGLSLLPAPNLFFCAAPGFVLCFCWMLLMLHRKPDNTWQPRKLSLREMASCRSVLITPELLFTGGMRIGRVASPIELSKTLSVRSQSSSFLLATAAALTCPCITDAADFSAIHHSLTALGVDPAMMQQQWRLISRDTPEGLSGVTVQDGSGMRCFCMGDPLTLALSCGYILTGNARPMSTEDRTALLRTLDGMKQAGGSAIAYAMLDNPDQPIERAVFLGMLSLEPELYPFALQELSALRTDADVFIDMPDGFMPDALRGTVHPAAQCPDKPVCITARPRRSACLVPVRSELIGWSAALLDWKHWSLELMHRARFALLVLIPAVIWLLLGSLHPGTRSMTLALAPAAALLFLQRYRTTPKVSIRWLIVWPVFTMILALFVTVIGSPDGNTSLFLPGMIVCAFAGQTMFLLPTYMAYLAEQRRAVLIAVSIITVVTAVLVALFLPGTWVLPIAPVIGAAWGTGTMIFLSRRLEQRM